MKSHGFSVVVALLLAAFATANEPKFQVDGEITWQIKSPFELYTNEPVDIAFWSSSAGVKLERLGTQRARITAPAGKHSVTLEGYRIDWDSRQTVPVVIEGSFVVVGDAPPTDPVNPGEPAPTPGVEGVEKASQAAAAKLNDPTTANAIFKAVNSIDQSGDIEQIRLRYRKTVADVLLNRKKESRDIAWMNWRVAVSDAIDALPQPLTKETYLAAIAAAIKPLRSTVTTRKTAKVVQRIVAYTTDTCEPCEQWKKFEAPKFEKAGYDIKYVTATSGQVPRFDVTAGPWGYHYQGYLSVGVLQSLLRDESK